MQFVEGVSLTITKAPLIVNLTPHTMRFNTIKLNSADTSKSNTLDLAQTVMDGLSKTPKALPSWILFDDRGGEMFNKITQLENYPPSACEFEIIRNHAGVIAGLPFENGLQLIELGAGDGAKAVVLIDQLLKEGQSTHYIPIDITEGAVRSSIKNLESKFKESGLSASGLIGDFFQGLGQATESSNRRNMILFLGATLGNMDYTSMEKFLTRLRESLNTGDYVVIGFDLMKHPKLLYDAYNDNHGFFEDFNLHMLDRINETLGGDFKKENFVQQAQYNKDTRSIESYLFSTCEQSVYISALEKEFHFKAWETLQTERSYKYEEFEIDSLAESSGFETIERLYDSQRQYVMPVWQAKKM